MHGWEHDSVILVHRLQPSIVVDIPLCGRSLRAKWASSSCLLRQAKSAHYINGLEPSQAGSLSSPSSTCQWQFSVVFGKLLLRLSPVLFFLLLFHSSMPAMRIIFYSCQNRRKGIIVGNEQEGDDTIVVCHVCECLVPSWLPVSYFLLFEISCFFLLLFMLS